MDVLELNQSAIGGHTCYFQTFAITNSASVNNVIFLRVCAHVCVRTQDKLFRSGIAV